MKPQDFEELLESVRGAVDEGPDRALGRGGDPDGVHRAAPRPGGAGRAGDAERAGDGPRGDHGPLRRLARLGASTSRLAEEVLAHLGPVVRVAEPYMDAVTAVSGSGPAYFALLAEAMIEAGILLGLSREISTQLVVQTMLGTAVLLRDEQMHPVELREAVTSPGGTTIRAIRELEQAGVRAAFLNAIQAAMERSQELASGHD